MRYFNHAAITAECPRVLPSIALNSANNFLQRFDIFTPSPPEKNTLKKDSYSIL